MNNTKTLAIVAIFMAATLVVGTLATTTTIATTQSAFAYNKDSGNGNTVTIEECKNRGSASGFDTALDQECENLICTHPGESATCTQEGAVAVAAAQTPVTPVKSPCEQCFTSLLTPTQINKVVDSLGATSLADLCRILEQNKTLKDTFSDALDAAGVSGTTGGELIQCLLKAGIVFIND